MDVGPALGAAGLAGGEAECHEMLELGTDQVWEVSPEEGDM